MSRYDCLKKTENSHCPLQSGCVFRDLWQRAKISLSDIFDSTTLQELVDKHLKSNNRLDYTI